MRPKEVKFIALFNYWCGKLLNEFIIIKRDNRSDNPAYVFKDMVKYNWNILKSYNEANLLNIIFHEIGHLKFNNPYGTLKQRIKAENQAERFSIRCIKKYYPKHYKEVCKKGKEFLSKESVKISDNIHYQAYKTIKDYN